MNTQYTMINDTYLAKVLGIEGDGTFCALDLVEAALSEIRLAKALLGKVQVELLRKHPPRDH